MRFKNNSTKVKRFKLPNGWVDVDPEGTFEANRELDKNENGLIKAEMGQSQEISTELKAKPQPKKERLKTSQIKPQKTMEELKKMTKDQLNDYAANNGLKTEIKQSMKKDTMVEKIFNYLKKKWQN
jgi:beta-lactam-binding protein with PASTA domain